MKTLFYTCCDKEYSVWIPLYSLGLLLNNKDLDIEIGIESSLDDNLTTCLSYIRTKFPQSKIIIKEKFFERIGNKAIVNGITMLFNTVRFVTTPILLADYIYIGDIDIVCLETNIVEKHIKNMKKLGINYSNIIRPNDPSRMSGLHFSKWDSYYPIPDLSKINLSDNDEKILKQIVEMKGEMICNTTKFRPVHGIYFSNNRPTVAGDGRIPGWGAQYYRERWSKFVETDEYKFVFPLLDKFVRQQIAKLEDYYMGML